jgi:hypothetical protein
MRETARIMRRKRWRRIIRYTAEKNTDIERKK